MAEWSREDSLAKRKRDHNKMKETEKVFQSGVRGDPRKKTENQEKTQ